MAGSRAKVTGLPELKKAFDELGVKQIDSIAYRATKKGAHIIEGDAEHRVRIQDLYETGALHRNIVVAKLKEAGGRLGYAVGVRSGRKEKGKASGFAGSKGADDPWYWWFHEFGTSRMPARPFLGPAFRSKGEAAAKALKDAAVMGIMKAAKKLGLAK